MHIHSYKVRVTGIDAQELTCWIGIALSHERPHCAFGVLVLAYLNDVGIVFGRHFFEQVSSSIRDDFGDTWISWLSWSANLLRLPEIDAMGVIMIGITGKVSVRNRE